jgi:hypothetical protein
LANLLFRVFQGDLNLLFREESDSVYDALLKWKRESNGSTALLIDSARRVGKSFIAEQFAKLSAFYGTVPSGL